MIAFVNSNSRYLQYYNVQSNLLYLSSLIKQKLSLFFRVSFWFFNSSLSFFWKFSYFIRRLKIKNYFFFNFVLIFQSTADSFQFFFLVSIDFEPLIIFELEKDFTMCKFVWFVFIFIRCDPKRIKISLFSL